MYNLLILESESIFKIGISSRLERENKNIKIETAESISQILQSSLFKVNEVKQNYDLFIVSLNKQDEQVLSLIKYTIKHKPELPILIFSYESADWLFKQGINTKPVPGRYIKKVTCWADIQQEVNKLFNEPVKLTSAPVREITTDFSLPSRRTGEV
ncbi:hypothetical protein L0657_25215 [Dyadobacter sp. CY345]|uniref:hypothetical protein n=1 Tax=Dyadobacter sp. CY345 TaxID=2909335 RepID=UPI001F371A5E|nr:hypothetical protein [Dyadobacter sp. CY345]MCF2447280.1 hypothetical protein [Dyadobacter sp. CY345]